MTKMYMMRLIPGVLALAATASAAPIKSDSAVGRNLLSKARVLNADGTEGRALENNNNYYTSWMKSYSLKFDGCHSVPQFEREEGMRSTLLAKFKMCPSDNCETCPNPGEYIVEMRDFVEAYTEAQQTINEYACETQKETCEYQCENGLYQYQNGDDMVNGNNYNYNNNNNNNNNNGDDNDYCYYTCMSDAGLSFCDDEQQDGQNMDELMECRQLGEDNNNNNNNNNYQYNSNYQVYYVGAYCTSSGVYVGTFTDSSCSKFAPTGTYEKYMGYSLPTQNFVGNDCISCKNPENDQNNNNGNNNNNNNNNNNGDDVFEVCEKLYEDAGKCEEKMGDGNPYKNNMACDLMHNTLKRLDSAYQGKRPASYGLAWFFGIACAGLIGYIAWFHNKVAGRQINLLPNGNGSTA